MVPTPAPAHDCAEEARLVEILRQGIRDADADRPAEAERRFREVLAATRGRGTHSERFACSCLVKLFARQHRDVEGLVLARHHVSLANALGDVEAVCMAHAGLGDAFARIEDWGRLDESVAQFERALSVYDGRYKAPLTRCLHRLRAEGALARGDAESAQTELDRIAVVGLESPDEPEQERATLLFEADIALRTGRPAAARAALARIAAAGDGTPGGADALDAEFLAVRCALAIDGPPAAAIAAGRMLASLSAPGAALHGAAARIRYARLLGDLAAVDCCDRALATRAYDVAAAIVLVRAAELERVVRELPELGILDAGDSEALAEYRTRFVADQEEMLAAVARLLRARVEAGDIPSWAAHSPAGTVDVCAWCLQVRLADGALVPLGHFLPKGSGLRVSHGICGACLSRVSAPAPVPAASAAPHVA